MNRREFLASTGAVAAASAIPAWGQRQSQIDSFPENILRDSPYTEVVKELCDEAHKHEIKIDLYFSHPDWYNADFRPYGQHPLQVPSSASLMISAEPARPEFLRRQSRHCP
jgi:hypothetical protein